MNEELFLSIVLFGIAVYLGLCEIARAIRTSEVTVNIGDICLHVRVKDESK